MEVHPFCGYASVLRGLPWDIRFTKINNKSEILLMFLIKILQIFSIRFSHAGVRLHRIF